MRVLELNDAGLRICDQAGVLANSPGYAALDGKTLLVGDAARERHRIDPRRSHDRFWYQLDAILDKPMAEARSAADLAHAHLKSLGSALCEEPLLIAAAGSFTPAQLGLCLGLLQAVDAKVLGLLDPAVAAASQVETLGQVIHIDVQLHRFVLTILAGDRALERQRIQEHKPGLAAVQDRCAAVCAQAFVSQSRFDPLHNANTEQLLYNALPEWLDALSRSSNAVLELASGGKRHRATVDRADLVEALGSRFKELSAIVQPVLQQQPTTVLLSARAAQIPGLAALFPGAVLLDALSVAQGALMHASEIESDASELAWVTRLPRRAVSGPVHPVRAGRASHVLIGAQAHPLPPSAQPLALSSWLPGAPGLVAAVEDGIRLESVGGGGVRVNGQVAKDSQKLYLGDRIAAAGQEVRLIEVLD